jgi:hypothetical protein
MIEFSQNKILFLKTRFCFSKQDFVSQNKIWNYMQSNSLIEMRKFFLLIFSK